MSVLLSNLNAAKSTGNSEGSKNKEYLAYHEDLGEIRRDVIPIDTMQINGFTKFPYVTLPIDPSYGENTDLDRRIGQSDTVGYYPNSNDYPGVLTSKHTPTYFTAELVKKSIKRLQKQQQRSETAEPWFVTASFHSPHPPFTTTWEYVKKYLPERRRILIQPNMIKDDGKTLRDDDLADMSTPLKELSKWYKPSKSRYRDTKKVQELTAVYYAMIEEVDKKIGQLLDSGTHLKFTCTSRCMSRLILLLTSLFLHSVFGGIFCFFRSLNPAHTPHRTTLLS